MSPARQASVDKQGKGCFTGAESKIPRNAWWPCLALSVVFAAVAHSGSTAEVERLPSNEDLRHFRVMEDPQLSPDGRKVLLRIKDSTADGGRGHLWLIETDGSPPRQLTYSSDDDPYGEREGRWTSDGHNILFLAHRGSHTQLLQLPIDGGEAKALEVHVSYIPEEAHGGGPEGDSTSSTYPSAALSADIDLYRVSPAGGLIAIIARDPETPYERRRTDTKADAVWVDHDRRGTRLYLIDPLTTAVQSVRVPPDVLDVSWSADGRRLAVICETTNGGSDLAPAASAWLVSMADLQTPTRLVYLPTTIKAVAWAASGESLFFLAQSAHDAPPDYSDLYVYKLKTNLVRNLSSTLDGSIKVAAKPVAVAHDGVALLVVKNLQITVAMWRTSSASPDFLQLPFASVSEISTNAGGHGWVFLGSSSGHSPGVFYATDFGLAPRRLPTPALVPPGVKSVVAKPIHWNNGRLTIEGLLYLPPEATQSNRIPLLVEVHGGPTDAYTDEYDQFVDFLIGRGWAVLRPNPRGSMGRGAAFAAANRRDLGGGDYRDIMAGVDFALKTASLDPTKLALLGYSYGGEMAAFVEGKSTRFRAIISGAPVIDQISEYGTEAPSSWYDRWFLGKPWERLSDAWRQSPLSSVSNAKTPLLLLHGERDTDDPPGQSYEMYRSLRQLGVTVDLVIYPRADHAQLLAAIEGRPSAEPWHGFDARRRMVEFIEHAFATNR